MHAGPKLAVLLVGVLAVSASSRAQTLQEVLEDVNIDDRWTYNNWEAAQEAAVRTSKPILALFR